MAYGDGQPSTWEQQVRAWDELAVTHLRFNMMGAGLQGPQDHLRALQAFAAAVGANQ